MQVIFVVSQYEGIIISNRIFIFFGFMRELNSSSAEQQQKDIWREFTKP